MKISKLFKNFCRDINIAAFVIAVNALTAIQDFSNLLLRHILILAQIAYSSVHNNHLTVIIIP